MITVLLVGWVGWCHDRKITLSDMAPNLKARMVILQLMSSQGPTHCQLHSLTLPLFSLSIFVHWHWFQHMDKLYWLLHHYSILYPLSTIFHPIHYIYFFQPLYTYLSRYTISITLLESVHDTVCVLSKHTEGWATSDIHISHMTSQMNCQWGDWKVKGTSYIGNNP